MGRDGETLKTRLAESLPFLPPYRCFSFEFTWNEYSSDSKRKCQLQVFFGVSPDIHYSSNFLCFNNEFEQYIPKKLVT